jgi:hypothetical protein
MLNWPEPQNTAIPIPKTLRFCKTCGKETAHQVRSGAGVIATVCVPCLERALQYELDRD